MKLLPAMAFFAALLLAEPSGALSAADRPKAESRDHQLILVGGLTREAVLVSVSATHLSYRLAGVDAPLGSEDTVADVKRVELASVVMWGRRREMRHLPQWLLRDGGVLIANVLDVNAQAWRGGDDPLAFASVTSLWPAVRVPSSRVAGAILQPPFATSDRDRLARQLRKRASSDRLWLADGNVVAGELVAARGTDRSSLVELWQVKVRNRPVQLDHRRLRAVQLESGAPQPGASDSRGVDSKPIVWLGFLDGSHVGVHRMTAKQGMMRLELAGAGWVEIPEDSFAKNICYVRPFHENVSYLADVEPLEQRHRPVLTVARPLQREANVLGELPRVENRIYTKSLGVSSESFLVYDLEARMGEGPKWSWFVSDVALDDAAALQGSVEFRVFLQDAEQPWRAAAKSGIVRGGDPPRTLRVKLSGASRIALVVSYGERGDMSDFANWLDPRLER